jgi:hypothetical protein
VRESTIAASSMTSTPLRGISSRRGVIGEQCERRVQGRALLRLARERNTNVVAIGDPRQIQAVGAGGCWGILQAAAREAGTFAELTENRRQIHDWHQRAVALTSRAIEREDAPTFARAAHLLERNGALDFVPTKDDAIAAAVTRYQSERKTSPDVLLVASDRDTVRYLNEGPTSPARRARI